MARVIDTAVVEYVPEFRTFARVTDRELGRVFDDVERDAAQTTRTIERSFDTLASDIAQVFGDIARTGRVDMEMLSDVVNRTAEDMAAEFERNGEEAENTFSELRRTANRELDRIDSDVTVATTGIGRRFNAMAALGGAAFLGLGAVAAAGLGAITTFGLISAAQLEQVQVSFNALLGSAEEGERVFRQLQEFAAATPFEFAGVADAAKRFLTFNEAIGLADDQLLDFLTTVGNIASVTGAGAEGMNRIAFAIGQIASRGRVQLEEINQISEAIPGFSALGAIAQEFGITTAEAMDKISAGEVDAVAGVNAILAGMAKFPGAAGAMEAQAQTLQGVFSTFKDTVSIALADAFAPVIPDIKDALTQLTPIVGSALEKLAPLLGDLVATIAPLLGGLIDLIVPVLAPILEALGPALAELAPAMGPLGEALGQIIIALIPLIPLFTQLLILAAEVATPILGLLVPALELLTPVLEIVTDGIRLFIAMISGGDADAATEGLADSSKSFLGWLDSVKGFFEEIPKVWDTVINFFKSLPGRIWGFIKSIPSLIGKLFGMAFDMAFEMIGFGIGLIIVAVTRLPGLIIDALVALPGLLSDFFSGLWTNAKETTETVGNGIWEWVKSLPGRIMDAITSLPGTLANFFRNAFENAKTIVSSAISAIVDFMKNLPSRISSFAMDVGNGIINFFKSVLNRAIDGLNSGIARVDDIIPGSLPRLPRLAHGGIAMGPALIGETSGAVPEAAIPLGDSRAMRMLVDAFSSAQQPSSVTQLGSNVTVIVQIDGQQLEGRIIGVVEDRERRVAQRVKSRRGF